MTHPNQILVSMMIAGAPRIINGRAILSASDAVWDAVAELPNYLRSKLTDDVGGENTNYGGFLFPGSINVLEEIIEAGYYYIFRGVEVNDIKHTDCVNAVAVDNFKIELVLAGWDVVSGNGWVSASCRGYFPIDPFGGDDTHESSAKVNQYGLISSYEECRYYVGLNNSKINNHAPWYGVSIYTQNSILKEIDHLLIRNKTT